MSVRHSVRRLGQRRPVWPRRFRPHGQDVVLLYHRIADVDTDDPGGMVVPPALFRRHLEALADWFSVVPAADIMSCHNRPTAAITLDDGYLDNLREAVPVLRDLHLPATFFVVVEALGRGSSDAPAEFWWDRLEHLLLEPGPGAARLELEVGGRRLQLDLADPASRRASYLQVSSALHRQPPAGVRGVLMQLEAAQPRVEFCDRHRRVTAEQVRHLGQDPLFEVGSHTCTHAALARLPQDASRREVEESRDRLQAVLGEPPRLLAYPYGAPGMVSRRNAREARAAGYGMAFANVPGPVEGANPFAVPRISVGGWSVDELHRAVTAWRHPR